MNEHDRMHVSGDLSADEQSKGGCTVCGAELRSQGSRYVYCPNEGLVGHIQAARQLDGRPISGDVPPIVDRLDAAIEKLSAHAARRELTTMEPRDADDLATLIAQARVAIVDCPGCDERDRIIIERDNQIAQLDVSADEPSTGASLP